MLFSVDAPEDGILPEGGLNMDCVVVEPPSLGNKNFGADGTELVVSDSVTAGDSETAGESWEDAILNRLAGDETAAATPGVETLVRALVTFPNSCFDGEAENKEEELLAKVPGLDFALEISISSAPPPRRLDRLKRGVVPAVFELKGVPGA
jgi:hypothetical protein